MWDKVIGLLGGSLFGGISELIGRFKLDPTVAAQLQAELQQREIALQQAFLVAQADINKAEASSPHLFVACWRPAIGWVCAASLAYVFVLHDWAAFALRLSGSPVLLPPPVMAEHVLELVMGMLGLAGWRSFDKKNGVASQ